MDEDEMRDRSETHAKPNKRTMGRKLEIRQGPNLGY